MDALPVWLMPPADSELPSAIQPPAPLFAVGLYSATWMSVPVRCLRRPGNDRLPAREQRDRRFRRGLQQAADAATLRAARKLRPRPSRSRSRHRPPGCRRACRSMRRSVCVALATITGPPLLVVGVADAGADAARQCRPDAGCGDLVGSVAAAVAATVIRVLFRHRGCRVGRDAAGTPGWKTCVPGPVPLLIVLRVRRRHRSGRCRRCR